MKTLIGVLIFISFLESTILPLNLVLIILIARSYLGSDKENLYLAFGFGFLLSFLNLNILGKESIIYLILIQITQVLSRSRLAGNPLLIVPLTFLFLSLNQLILNNFNLTKIIIESLLSLPVLYMVRIWEERFIVRKDIKLRV